MVGFHPHALRSLADRHRSRSRQNFGQHAVVTWIEMLNEYHGKASVAWQEGQQAFENLQSACGSPDADHRYGRTCATSVFGRRRGRSALAVRGGV